MTDEFDRIGPNDDLLRKIWYIQATISDSESIKGTGVAIRLRRMGSKGTHFTCLLTCAHVVRKSVVANQNDETEDMGAGIKNIVAWQHSKNYGKGHKLYPSQDIIPFVPHDVVEDEFRKTYYSQPAEYIREFDWAILEFEDHKQRTNRDAFVDFGSPTLHSEYRILGFPDGDNSFKGEENGNENKVRGTPTEGSPALTEGNTFLLSGSDAKQGCSGGAVVGDDGKLVGIHRAGNSKAGQSYEISLKYIASRLEEEGFEFANDDGERGAETSDSGANAPEISTSVKPVDVSSVKQPSSNTVEPPPSNHPRWPALNIRVGCIVTAMFLLGLLPAGSIFFNKLPSNLNVLSLPAESLATAELITIGGESAEEFNRKLSELKTDKIEKFDFVFLGKTDFSTYRTSQSKYLLRSTKNVKLFVYPVLWDRTQNVVRADFKAKPSITTSDAIEIATLDSNPIPPNRQIMFLIAVKLPEGSALSADEVMSSITLTPK